MFMNADAEFLNFVYQNSQMGVETLRQLIEITKDLKFKVYLEGQQREYDAFHQEARERLNDQGMDEKGLTVLEKVRTYLMINFQTMVDDSTSHIAEMLMVGSNMGIVDALKKISEYREDASPESLRLMEKLKKFEEDNMESLKGFIS